MSKSTQKSILRHYVKRAKGILPRSCFRSKSEMFEIHKAVERERARA